MANAQQTSPSGIHQSQFTDANNPLVQKLQTLNRDNVMDELSNLPPSQELVVYLRNLVKSYEKENTGFKLQLEHFMKISNEKADLERQNLEQKGSIDSLQNGLNRYQQLIKQLQDSSSSWQAKYEGLKVKADENRLKVRNLLATTQDKKFRHILSYTFDEPIDLYVTQQFIGELEGSEITITDQTQTTVKPLGGNREVEKEEIKFLQEKVKAANDKLEREKKFLNEKMEIAKAELDVCLLEASRKRKEDLEKIKQLCARLKDKEVCLSKISSELLEIQKSSKHDQILSFVQNYLLEWQIRTVIEELSQDAEPNEMLQHIIGALDDVAMLRNALERSAWLSNITDGDMRAIARQAGDQVIKVDRGKYTQRSPAKPTTEYASAYRQIPSDRLFSGEKVRQRFLDEKRKEKSRVDQEHTHSAGSYVHYRSGSARPSAKNADMYVSRHIPSASSSSKLQISAKESGSLSHKQLISEDSQNVELPSKRQEKLHRLLKDGMHQRQSRTDSDRSVSSSASEINLRKTSFLGSADEKTTKQKANDYNLISGPNNRGLFHRRDQDIREDGITEGVSMEDMPGIPFTSARRPISEGRSGEELLDHVLSVSDTSRPNIPPQRRFVKPLVKKALSVEEHSIKDLPRPFLSADNQSLRKGSLNLYSAEYSTERVLPPDQDTYSRINTIPPSSMIEETITKPVEKPVRLESFEENAVRALHTIQRPSQQNQFLSEIAKRPMSDRHTERVYMDKSEFYPSKENIPPATFAGSQLSRDTIKSASALSTAEPTVQSSSQIFAKESGSRHRPSVGVHSFQRFKAFTNQLEDVSHSLHSLSLSPEDKHIPASIRQYLSEEIPETATLSEKPSDEKAITFSVPQYTERYTRPKSFADTQTQTIIEKKTPVTAARTTKKKISGAKTIPKAFHGEGGHVIRLPRFATKPFSIDFDDGPIVKDDNRPPPMRREGGKSEEYLEFPARGTFVISPQRQLSSDVLHVTSHQYCDDMIKFMREEAYSQSSKYKDLEHRFRGYKCVHRDCHDNYKRLKDELEFEKKHREAYINPFEKQNKKLIDRLDLIKGQLRKSELYKKTVLEGYRTDIKVIYQRLAKMEKNVMKTVLTMEREEKDKELLGSIHKTAKKSSKATNEVKRLKAKLYQLESDIKQL